MLGEELDGIPAQCTSATEAKRKGTDVLLKVHESLELLNLRLKHLIGTLVDLVLIGLVRSFHLR